MSKALPLSKFLVNPKLIAYEHFGILSAFSGSYFNN